MIVDLTADQAEAARTDRILYVEGVPDENLCRKSNVTGDGGESGTEYAITTGCACHRPEWFADDPFAGCDECRRMHPRLPSIKPPEWRKATKPCETCEGTGCDIDWCQRCGDEYDDPCTRHSEHPHEGGVDECCQDCVAGRPKITVRVPCETCDGRGVCGGEHGGATAWYCQSCWTDSFEPGDGYVPVFTCTADKIVPVVAFRECRASVTDPYPEHVCLGIAGGTRDSLILGPAEWRDLDLSAWPEVGPGWFAVLLDNMEDA